MAGFSSLLKEVIKKFPAKQTIKGESLEPMFKKQGVKEDELEFSGVREQIDPNARYDKEGLESLEANRVDNFTSTDEVDNPSYAKVSTEPNNPSYRETVHEFSQGHTTESKAQLIERIYNMEPEDAFLALQDNFTNDEAWKIAEAMGSGEPVDAIASKVSSKNIASEGRYSTAHFPTYKNYLGHTRAINTSVEGRPATVVLELQSDLHQAGRQQGYVEGDVSQHQQKLTEEYQSWLNKKGYPKVSADELEFEVKLPEEDLKYVREFSKKWDSDVIKSPLEKNWLRKLMERELVRSTEEGTNRIAIPIKGDLEQLQRGQGVQKWYETKVLNTAKKLAKQTKSNFKLVEETQVDAAISEGLEHVANNDTLSALHSFRFSSDERVRKLAIDALQGRGKTSEVIKEVRKINETPIQYAVIETKPESKLDFKLYSGMATVGAAGALGASETQAAELSQEQKQKLLSAGYNEEQIKAYEKKKALREKVQTKMPAQAAQELNNTLDGSSSTKTKSSISPSQGLTHIEYNDGGLKSKTLNIPSFVRSAKAKGYSDLQIARRVASLSAPDYASLTEQDFVAPNELLKQQVNKAGSKDVWERDAQGILVEIPTERKRQSLAFKIYKGDSEAIIEEAKKLGVDPRTKVGIDAVYKSALTDINMDKATSMLLNLKEVNNIDRPVKWIRSFVGDEKAGEALRQAEQKSEQNIISLARERGLILKKKEGGFFVQLDDGTERLLSSDLLDEMGMSKYEIIGGVGGAIAGYAKTSKVLDATGPYGAKTKAALKSMGALVGSVGGAVAGDQIDYLVAAADAHVDWTSEVALEKAIGTAQTTALFDLGLGAAAKVLGKSKEWTAHLYRSLRDGNVKGAVETVKKAHGGMTDEQMEELVQRWTDLNKVSPPGKNADEAGIAIVSATQPGGETLVSNAAKISPDVSFSIGNEISKRAADLLSLSKEKITPELGVKLMRSMESYESGVKTQFQVAKDKGLEIVPEGYTFDFDPAAIRTIINHQASVVSDPAKSNQLANILINIDSLTTSRTFEDLLDLRTVVNEFKFKNKKLGKRNKEMLEETLKSIDSEIDRATSVSPLQKQWKQQWKDANIEYAKFKKLQDNALFKLVSPEGLNKGISEKVLAKRLLKFADSPDVSSSSKAFTQSTIDEFTSKLPPKLRAGVENAMLDTVIERAATGKIGELRSIQWPQLSDELKSINFKTPHASQLKEVINRMSEVYRNDPKLLQASRTIAAERQEQTIATSLWGKLKMALLNKAWLKLRRLAPGTGSDAAATTLKIAELLENPLNAKTVREAMEAVKGDYELESLITQAQAQAAAEVASGKAVPRVKIYKSKEGLNLKQQGKETGEAIPAHRVTSDEMVFELTGKTDLKDLTVADKKRLLEKGYLLIVKADGTVLKLK